MARGEPRNFSLQIGGAHVGRSDVLAPIVGATVRLFELPSNEDDTPTTATITLQAQPNGVRLAKDRGRVQAIVTWSVNGGQQKARIEVPRQASIVVLAGSITVDLELVSDTPAQPDTIGWTVSGQIGLSSVQPNARAFFATHEGIAIGGASDVPIVSGCASAEVFTLEGIVPGAVLAFLDARDVDLTPMYSQILIAGVQQRPLRALGPIVFWRLTPPAGLPLDAWLVQYVGP